MRVQTGLLLVPFCLPLLLVLPSACQQGPYPVDSPYFNIPTGSRVQLKQTLTIPPELGRVNLQYGKIVQRFDQYQAHCAFVSWNIQEQNQYIKPDSFIVTAVKYLEEYVSIPSRQLYARAGGFPVSDAGATAIEYSTVLSIHSASQPDIREFICSHWEDPADAHHLTISQIRRALGDIADIELELK